MLDDGVVKELLQVLLGWRLFEYQFVDFGDFKMSHALDVFGLLLLEVGVVHQFEVSLLIGLVKGDGEIEEA